MTECHTTRYQSSYFIQSRENADHFALHSFAFSLVTEGTDQVVISGMGPARDSCLVFRILTAVNFKDAVTHEI